MTPRYITANFFVTRAPSSLPINFVFRYCHTNSFIKLKGRDKTTTSHQTTQNTTKIRHTKVLQRVPIKNPHCPHPHSNNNCSMQQEPHSIFFFDNVMIVCPPAVCANFYSTTQTSFLFFYTFFISFAVSPGCKIFLPLRHMTQGFLLICLPGVRGKRGQYPCVHSGVGSGGGDCDGIGDQECIAGLVLLVRQKKHAFFAIARNAFLFLLHPLRLIFVASYIKNGLDFEKGAAFSSWHLAAIRK
jgi:hypothetical protein